MLNIVVELVRTGLMEEAMNRAECHANMPFSDILSFNESLHRVETLDPVLPRAALYE